MPNNGNGHRVISHEPPSVALLVILFREEDKVISDSHGAGFKAVAVLADVLGVAGPLATLAEGDDVRRVHGVHSLTIV